MTTNASANDQWYDKTWLVILLCLFIFPIGLYALWKSDRFSKSWKMGGTTVLVLLIIALAATQGEAAPETPAKTESAPAPEPAPAAEKEPEQKGQFLFKAPEDFKTAFNTQAGASNINLEIGDVSTQEGEVNNTFNATINENLAIVGSVHKTNGTVQSIMMIGTGDGTAQSGANIILCMGAVIAAADPSIKPEGRMEILKELGLMGDADVMNLSTKTERNGIKYSINSNEVTGMILSVSPKEKS
ncbi:MAG TPA: hypothetical protein VFR58_12335 [Flavisolibacter sp.]|nr:hypothetical protein [Flavisolibacter sp.]